MLPGSVDYLRVKFRKRVRDRVRDLCPGGREICGLLGDEIFQRLHVVVYAVCRVDVACELLGRRFGDEPVHFLRTLVAQQLILDEGICENVRHIGVRGGEQGFHNGSGAIRVRDGHGNGDAEQRAVKVRRGLRGQRLADGARGGTDPAGA